MMNIALSVPTRENPLKAYGNGIMMIINEPIALNAINSHRIDSKLNLDVLHLKDDLDLKG